MRKIKFYSYRNGAESISANGGANLKISLWSKGCSWEAQIDLTIVCDQCLTDGWSQPWQ